MDNDFLKTMHSNLEEAADGEGEVFFAMAAVYVEREDENGQKGARILRYRSVVDDLRDQQRLFVGNTLPQEFAEMYAEYIESMPDSMMEPELEEPVVIRPGDTPLILP